MIAVDFYWICAHCGCRYLASQANVYVDPYPACPACGEEEDVFRADTWGNDDGDLGGVWNAGSFRPSKGPKTWDWQATADRRVAMPRHAGK